MKRVIELTTGDEGCGERERKKERKKEIKVLLRCDEKERNLVPEKDSAIKQENEIYSTNVCERKRERNIEKERRRSNGAIFIYAFSHGHGVSLHT